MSASWTNIESEQSLEMPYLGNLWNFQAPVIPEVINPWESPSGIIEHFPEVTWIQGTMFQGLEGYWMAIAPEPTVLGCGLMDVLSGFYHPGYGFGLIPYQGSYPLGATDEPGGHSVNKPGTSASLPDVPAASTTQTKPGHSSEESPGVSPSSSTQNKSDDDAPVTGAQPKIKGSRGLDSLPPSGEEVNPSEVKPKTPKKKDDDPLTPPEKEEEGSTTIKPKGKILPKDSTVLPGFVGPLQPPVVGLSTTKSKPGLPPLSSEGELAGESAGAIGVAKGKLKGEAYLGDEEARIGGSAQGTVSTGNKKLGGSLSGRVGLGARTHLNETEGVGTRVTGEAGITGDATVLGRKLPAGLTGKATIGAGFGPQKSEVDATAKVDAGVGGLEVQDLGVGGGAKVLTGENNKYGASINGKALAKLEPSVVYDHNRGQVDAGVSVKLPKIKLPWTKKTYEPEGRLYLSGGQQGLGIGIKLPLIGKIGIGNYDNGDDEKPEKIEKK